MLSTSRSFRVDQSINLNFRCFELCAKQHLLNDTLIVAYFANSLEEPALTSFQNTLDELSRTQNVSSHRVSAFMRTHYDSMDKQNANYNLPTNFLTDSVMATNGIASNAHGLQKLITIINAKTPVCPVKNITDDDKIPFLRRAAIGNDCAKHLIQQLARGISWSKFQTELLCDTQMSEEEQKFDGSQTPLSSDWREHLSSTCINFPSLLN